VVGLGEGENFVGSNVAAFLAEARRVQYPGDGDVIELTPQGVRFVRAEQLSRGADVRSQAMEAARAAVSGVVNVAAAA